MSSLDSGGDSVIAFRVADYDSPLRVTPHRSSGRFHRAGSPPTQYLAAHPAAAWAEAARNTATRAASALEALRRRLWVARIPRSGLLDVDLATSKQLGLTAEQLVGDDWTPCQAAADRCRELDMAGVIVPSAAFPGASSVVLFGSRVPVPFDVSPIDTVDVPVALAALDAHGPAGLLTLIRWRGDQHAGLEAHRRGLADPVVPLLV